MTDMSDMNGAPPKKKRTWLWILLGVVGFLFVAGLGTAAFTVYWLGNHMEIVETPAPDAAKSFDEVRAKFPGQRPLIEFRDGEPQGLSEDTAAPPSTVSLTTLHVIAFDEDEGRMVRVDVPFWLLRLKSGPIAFSSYTRGFDDRRARVRVEDIERRGPGIVLDLDRPREGRVLIWAE
jgi:flagellar basal body-associated protein FliL